MHSHSFEPLARILPAIEARATELDLRGDWPENDLQQLAHIGASAWFVPFAYGGQEIEPLELHLRYEAVASASVSIALLISQRDSAIGLIAASDNSGIKHRLLPALAQGEFFATIGIAQLTTSRQGGAPALVARTDGTDFVLNGTIPWSTGAAKAEFIVAGATLEDGRQILFALPTNLPGVKVASPMPLVALRASWTTSVELMDVRLSHEYLIRGPVDKVLSGRSKTVPIGQAYLAFGLCRGGLNLIARHDSDRARSMLAKFEEQLNALRTNVINLSKPGQEANAAEQGPGLRAGVNDLAVRITQSAVALYKGSALLDTHPAQRLAREAMFLLVWSCPDPVIDCTVNALANR